MSYGPSNLLRRPPTLSLWSLSICGTFLVVGLPVALRAGASTLLGWMFSYPVSRVGVGIAAACCLLLLAVAWASKLRCGPPTSSVGLYFNFNLPRSLRFLLTYLVSYGFLT